jgi:hypothetical protein
MKSPVSWRIIPLVTVRQFCEGFAFSLFHFSTFLTFHLKSCLSKGEKYMLAVLGALVANGLITVLKFIGGRFSRSV